MNKDQVEAFEKFTRLKVGALFMQMGTGKTRVAIELVDYNHCDLLIYIAPYSTLDNIRAEFNKWGLKTPHELVGYETISSSDSQYMRLLNMTEGKRCFIVADESIFIKNEETKRFNRLCSIRNKCEYALILNGTPLSKNEWDLYNQMYFLSPLIVGMPRQQFLNTFFKKITYKKKGHSEHSFYKFSEVNAEYLYKLISPYIFECDLNFDKRETEEYIYVPYSGDEYYQEKEDKLKEYMEHGHSDTIINMLTSLNVIAGKYDEKNAAVAKYIDGKRVIVFCNFLEELESIMGRVDCYVIEGGTKNRQGIIRQFKDDSKPLLITLGTGSYSLNLQFCNEIVYSSITFDYSRLIQSKFRIKRLGQERDIKYTYILTDLGINRMILENLSKKKTLENLIKEKMMEGGLEWLKDI